MNNVWILFLRDILSVIYTLLYTRCIYNRYASFFIPFCTHVYSLQAHLSFEVKYKVVHQWGTR